MITNMTEGSPHRILWKFSIPMLISVVFQQLYNIVDSIIAGSYVGTDALAAIGASYPITMIFMAVATGCNIGCSVVVSRLFGGNENGKMKTAVSTAIISVSILSITLTIIGILTSPPMLILLNTPNDILSASTLYLNIYIGGLFFLFLYNICNGIFTALGDSRTPLYFLIFSSVGNIVLDLVFVRVFNWGVAGVAWATFVAQGLSSILSIVTLLFRLKKIVTTEKYKHFSVVMLGKLGKVAVPSILQQSFISVGNLFIQGLINSYGSAAIAGYSAAVKINTFAITCFSTLSNGLSAFVSQNIGARKYQRIKKGYHAGLIMASIVAVIFTVIYFIYSKQIIELFLEKQDINQNVLSIGQSFLRIVTPFYVMICIKIMTDGIFRGAGSMGTFMIVTFADLIMRVVLAFVLSPILGVDGIWWSWPIGWAVATVLSVIFYFWGGWKKKIDWVKVNEE